jgi:hypothetical protein
MLSLLDSFQICLMMSVDSWLAGASGLLVKVQHMRIAVRIIALFDLSFVAGMPCAIRPSRALANSGRFTRVDMVLELAVFMMVPLINIG